MRHLLVWAISASMTLLLCASCAESGNVDEAARTDVDLGWPPATPEMGDPRMNAQEVLETRADEADESVGEAPDALTAINCKALGLDVVECMIRCAQAGIPCTPRLNHPRKADAGAGDLYHCGQIGSRKACSYGYTNGDECYVISGVPWVPCLYGGGS